MKYLSVPAISFLVLAIGQYIAHCTHAHAEYMRAAAVAIHAASAGVIPMP